jgi:hypothetical protein
MLELPRRKPSQEIFGDIPEGDTKTKDEAASQEHAMIHSWYLDTGANDDDRSTCEHSHAAAIIKFGPVFPESGAVKFLSEFANLSHFPFKHHLSPIRAVKCRTPSAASVTSYFERGSNDIHLDKCRRWLHSHDVRGTSIGPRRADENNFIILGKETYAC